ncbi:uncharacterized protein BXZ73DRAFT_47651 [Epithele typhae]|uniref:uncharacterized protein n=1 Tax=Epithele typhae TaxID=378194 RepID=UPI0020076C59|nr:uncharacterized protein BXZ73DRAFT_47651 [Epithele typhae]KAH9930486.1 hypothetical protein BXZ73DRAFT_47651 [Epithele typhae]
MLTDNPIQQSPYGSYNNIEDFLNLDLFNGPSSNGAGSSGSSPHSSPSNSFSGLPPTPPSNEFFSLQDISYSPSPFFSLAQDDDQSKLASLLPPATTAAGYDFLAQYSHLTQMSSPDSSGSGSGSGSNSSGESPASIDPQLMNTPAASKAASDFGGEEEEDEDDDLDLDLDSMHTIPEDFVVPQMKVGGKGKTNRKGTVRDGGIVKRSSAERKENMLSTTSVDPEDWRPSPEEYKKMSSKEKRQLRNKISARNFRVRRKEYITTLEGDIAERDRLIDAIRTELGSMKSENVAMRQEIDALKRALLEGRGRADTPVLPPPGPLPPVSAAARSSASSPAPATPRSPLLTPNTQKDLPTSPRLGARGFWGGAHGMGSIGSFTPVHTTLLPEWSNILSGKPPAGRKSPSLQENINPNLNGPTAAALAALLAARKAENAESQEKAREQQLPQQHMSLNGFDAFADVNPFTLKSMDAYRMQLWGKMAQQYPTQRPQLPGSQPSSPSGLASVLRPHFFTKGSSLGIAQDLSGKSPLSNVHAYPTPPNTPPLRATAPTSKPADLPTPQQAVLATVASQTLASKLGSAFWDAFARPSGSVLGANGSGKLEWDADKVRRVMEGTAVVRVVDVEPTSAPAQPPRAVPVRSTVSQRDECVACVTDLLAESMATLSIGRK